MQKTLTLFDTTLGKKAALAVSGLVLYGFVLAHMLGNLQVFLGPEVLNAYAAGLKAMPAVLWGGRFVVASAVVVHVAMMILLYQRSSAARPVAYHRVTSSATSYASATMKFTGPMLLCYLVFHILHFTAPGLALGDYEHSHTDVYGNLVNAFQLPWVVLIYCTANLLLGLHLYHGAWSLLQTLGLSHPRYNAMRANLSRAVALLITAGNVAMPLSVLFGIIG
jgi:succinate dehydrogenase / fumarate reductase cytochrome b subunit